jgi:RNA polymerase sigma-70 factor (ECF subfamily)
MAREPIHHEDRALLDRIRQRDRHAIALLFDRYSGIVYAVALRVMRDPARAEEAMSDIFMEIWRDPSPLMQVAGSLCFPMAAIARNWAIGQSLPGRKRALLLPDVGARHNGRSARNEQAKAFFEALPLDRQMQLESAFFQGQQPSNA